MAIKIQKMLILVLMACVSVTMIACSKTVPPSKSYEDCFKLSVELLKTPPKNADPHTLFCAIDYFEGKTNDSRTAFQRYLEMAETGYALAQYAVGKHYQDGIGVEKNIHKALYWLLKAAEQGDVTAQNNYGYIYFYGEEGIKKDRTKALIWLRKAADQGNASSKTLIAEAHEDGDGLPKDRKAAFDLYTQAAKADQIFAQYKLGFYYERGYGTKIDYEQACYWYDRSAHKGLAYAQFELGRCYLNGRGVDKQSAYMWFYIASKELDQPHVHLEMQKLEAVLSLEQIEKAKSLGDDFIKSLANKNRTLSQ